MPRFELKILSNCAMDFKPMNKLLKMIMENLYDGKHYIYRFKSSIVINQKTHFIPNSFSTIRRQ